MSVRPRTVVSTAADFDGGSSPAGILQWVIRFCQTPESLPVFLAWVRSISPDLPFTDAEIAEDLATAHDLVGVLLKTGLLS